MVLFRFYKRGRAVLSNSQIHTEISCMQNILLNDALQIMDGHEPFQIKFVTCNTSLKTGGKIIQLTHAKKVGSAHNQKENGTVTVKQLDNSNHPYPVHIHLIIEVNNKRIVI